MNTTKYPVSRNEILELDIENLAFGGKGIGHQDLYVIFVKDTVPGDRVRVKIIKRKPNYAEARLIEIIRPSKMRINAPCPYFAWCGGCTWQNLAYTDQLHFKRQHIIESLQHISGIDVVEVEETLPSPLLWGYRNKMEFSFSDRKWLLPSELGNMEISNTFALGLHIPGTFDKILDIDHCMLQSDRANNVLKLVDTYCQEENLTPYGIRSHVGFMRFLVIRESHSSGELMVNLVTAYREPDRLKPLANLMVSRIPEVTSVVNNINTRKAQIAIGEEEILLCGKNAISEKIGPLDFDISPNSFFQTNSGQAEALYRIVAKYAQTSGQEIVWDLYSGTGTIALFISGRVKKVYGFELVESAVNDAEKNAKINKINNVQFISGDLLKNIDLFSPLPDIVIVDPPRSGMHPGVCEKLAQIGAKRIVYVSCNPGTLARDIQLLSGQYRVSRVQPVDMFPHTYHIETVVLLEKINA